MGFAVAHAHPPHHYPPPQRDEKRKIIVETVSCEIADLTKRKCWPCLLRNNKELHTGIQVPIQKVSNIVRLRRSYSAVASRVSSAGCDMSFSRHAVSSARITRLGQCRGKGERRTNEHQQFWPSHHQQRKSRDGRCAVVCIGQLVHWFHIPRAYIVVIHSMSGKRNKVKKQLVLCLRCRGYSSNFTTSLYPFYETREGLKNPLQLAELHFLC